MGERQTLRQQRSSQAREWAAEVDPADMAEEALEVDLEDAEVPLVILKEVQRK